MKLGNPEELGAWIKAARTQGRLSAEDAAMGLDVSRQTMLNIEKTPGNVAFETVFRAAKEMGLTLIVVPPESLASVRHALKAASQANEGCNG